MANMFYLFTSIFATVFLSYGPTQLVYAADELPPVIHYDFSVTKNVSCIMADFSARLVPENAGQGLVTITNGTVNRSLSSCGSKNQVLAIDFFNGTVPGILKLNFTNQNNNTILSRVNITFVLGLTPETPYLSKENQTIFQVPEEKTFKCNSGLNVRLTKDGPLVVANYTLELRDLRINAFRTKPGQEYESESDCPADAPSDKTVPMIVGFVLALIVVIIFVGYIILRRREDQSAYQSV